MGEVRVVGIRIEQPQNQPVLLLRESNGDRYLPIWIGQTEATAIALEQQGVEPARPLTHDLIRDLITALHRQPDLVQPFEQAFAPERIERKNEAILEWRGDGPCL